MTQYKTIAESNHFIVLDTIDIVGWALAHKLTKAKLQQIPIFIPPLEEQHRIVSILDKFETLTNSITEGLPLAIEQSQKRYEYYRELLLNFS